MIVGERKPFDQIIEMLKPFKRILILGCKTCVTVCSAGGEKEVGILASELAIAREKEGNPIEIVEKSLERQCDTEYLDELDPMFVFVKKFDAILSMACGAGVQFVAEKFKDIPVFPALNTSFVGVALEQGVWSERCAQCGNCILHLTGGICPIARCSKSLLNGPCGGSVNGKCEVNPEIDCGWQLIYDRLEALGELDKLEEIIPAKDWSTHRDGGPRKIVREDLRIITEQDENHEVQ